MFYYQGMLLCINRDLVVINVHQYVVHSYCTALRTLLVTNSLSRVVSFAEILPLSPFSTSTNPDRHQYQRVDQRRKNKSIDMGIKLLGQQAFWSNDKAGHTQLSK